jgi:hypothetical protein
MSSRSVQRFAAATVALILPQTPVFLCLALRGAEAWKLLYEMGRLTTVAIVGWTWAAAFLAAAIVTIYHLDDNKNLRRWEVLIEIANTVTSGFLAWDCAVEATGTLRSLPTVYRFAALMCVLIVIQITVTFAARRARAVAHYLKRNAPPLAPPASPPPNPLGPAGTAVPV